MRRRRRTVESGKKLSADRSFIFVRLIIMSGRIMIAGCSMSLAAKMLARITTR
jgi:hypothetical protein